ncbi:MAG: HAD hydrolase-like protein [Candidatus Saccharimonadales bacterium]|jgi:phosphoglycolate phosphatase
MKAVIFDFDGTIADSLAAVIKVFEDITNRPKPFTKAEIEELQHKDLLQITLELNVQKWKIPWLIFRGRRMFKDHMRSVRVHSGIPDILADLHAHGVPLYVLSSNSRDNVQQYLRSHHLESYFTAIYGGAGLLGKARSLFRLFKQQGVDPKGSWYVGDETRDIIGAHAAGMKIISVSWGYNSRQALTDKNPDALVDTPEELAAVLQKIWKK